MTSERFKSSAAYQYYQFTPSVHDLATYVQQKICPRYGEPCLSRTEALSKSEYIDFDFDTISQALVITVFRDGARSLDGWSEQINNYHGGAKVEVGVLLNEKPIESEELSLSGYLAVLGEDEKPSMHLWNLYHCNVTDRLGPTRFSFPSRHHVLTAPTESIYQASFVTPTGLHPTLRLTFPLTSISPPAESCALHSYLTLPSTLFPDKYQLSAPLFLASKNLRSVRSISGETDLEAPDWAIDKWGSAMLIELEPPVASSKEATWHTDIPLHLRYLAPSDAGKAYVDVPWPIVFWACSAEEGTKMSTNPFDRVNLGYDGLFGPRTMFYHFHPNRTMDGTRSELVETLEVPTLDAKGATWLESGTVSVVLLGLFWVLWKLGLVAFRQERIRIASSKKGQ